MRRKVCNRHRCFPPKREIYLFDVKIPKLKGHITRCLHRLYSQLQRLLDTARALYEWEAIGV